MDVFLREELSAGVNALYEALDDAVARTQVIVTSQSSDLLDSEYTRLEHLRAVSNVDGVSQIRTGAVPECARAMSRALIATVVEGQGEVAAVPVLLRRMAAEIAPKVLLELPRPPLSTSVSTP